MFLNGGESDNRKSEAKDVIFIAPMPPPVTGRTLASEFVSRYLQAQGFRLANISIGRPRGPFPGYRRPIRLAVALSKIFALALRPRWRRASAYLAVDDGSGAYFTGLAAALLRCFSIPVVLHHHSFAYLGTRTHGMGWTVRAAGPEAIHATNCAAMAMELQRLYPLAARTLRLSNVKLTSAMPLQKQAEGPLILGHLSNLSEEKGIGVVGHLTERLAEQRLPCTLRIAGPMQDRLAEKVVDELTRRYEWVEYWGPVGGDRKTAFFTGLDMFLFPTLYPTESSPLVLFEAISAGATIVANARGCIREQFASTGQICDDPDDFVDAVLKMASMLYRDPAARHSARARSKAAFEAHLATGECDLICLCEALTRTQDGRSRPASAQQAS
jgi:glycosyltransferase involved in cell wall biosynthesis